jgi:hypothetical protein
MVKSLSADQIALTSHFSAMRAAPPEGATMIM